MSLSAKAITRLINALSKPFPSAWSIIHGNKILVKRAKPIEINLDLDFKNGQIVNKLITGELLVKTSNDLLLIEEYDFYDKNLIKRFECFDQSKHIKNVTKTY